MTGSTAKLQSNGRPSPPASKRRSARVTESEAVATVDRAAKRESARLHPRRPDVSEIPYTRLGLKIFFAILSLTAAMFLALAILAAVTYPSAADMHALLGAKSPTDSALQAWQGMRSQWLDQVVGLGQLLIFGSVLPLLATVVGYVLGERRRNS